MTQLTITPDYGTKKAVIVGAVSAGEKVEVTVKGGAALLVEGNALRLRVVGIYDTVLAQFPMPNTADAWTTAGTSNEDAVCVLDLGTQPMFFAASKFGLNAKAGKYTFILDDEEVDALYTRQTHEISRWEANSRHPPLPLADKPAKKADLDAHVADTTKHVTAEQKAAWNAKQDAISDLAAIRQGATAGGSAYQKPDGGIPKSDLDSEVQDALDNAASAITEHQDISHKAEKDDLEDEIETRKAHTDAAEIHVTQAQKDAWTGKQDAIADLSDIRAGAKLGATALQEHQDLSGYINGADYYTDPLSGKKYIRVKHGDTVIASIDASDFIKDGMVSSVEITGGNIVITFNTDAGADPISIPITDIFNPSNYYDKTTADGRFATKAEATLTVKYVWDVEGLVLGYGWESLEYDNGTWTLTYNTGGGISFGGSSLSSGTATVTTTGAANATSLTFVDQDDNVITATRRTVLQLGEQSDKPIQPAGNYVARDDVDDAVTRTSANPVKSSGIWSAIWGALAALPTGFTSLYDWCVSQLAGKMSSTATGADIPVDGAPGAQTINAALNGKLAKAVPVLWAELKALRDSGGLAPGQQYRITDYVATTNGDMESQSANHPFDIIVTADDERTLNEHARAILHDSDTYFASCDLAAWDVWYCLDNDTSRFTWAVADGGKGVVYRLVDEFGNDCPYDFKGILFKAYGDTDDVWRYTFDSGSASDNTDRSLAGISNRVYSNEISPYRASGKQNLNRIVFKGTYCNSNIFGASCYSNTFGVECFSNTFGVGCYSNTFGPFCSANTFDTSCFSNTFGSGCSYNTFSSYCYSNTFDSDCNYNTLGQYCFSNTLGPYCYNNTFGSNCQSNKFGAYCYSNTFGVNCGYNTFGAGCYYNMFGQYCSFNTFGSYCHSNTFGSSCSYIKFGTANTTKSYCRHVRVSSGNQNLYINPTGTTSYSSCYQNVEIKEGVNDTSTYKTITDSNVGQTFLTTYKPANSQEISI